MAHRSGASVRTPWTWSRSSDFRERPDALLPAPSCSTGLMLPDFERRGERPRNITNPVIDVAHFTWGNIARRLR